MADFAICECGRRFEVNATVTLGRVVECPACERARQRRGRESLPPGPSITFRNNPIRALFAVVVGVLCFLLILPLCATMLMRIAMAGFDGICFAEIVAIVILLVIASLVLRPLTSKRG